MAFSFIYTGYEPESGEISVTINGKDYRAHLNPADISAFEVKLRSGSKVDAMNFLKNRTMGGLKQVHDQPLNDSRMADLSLFGEEWDDMSWQEKEQTATKAGIGKKAVLKWSDLFQGDQIKLYQASRGGRMGTSLKEVQAGAELEGKLQEFYQLSQQLAKLTKEVKKLQASMGGLEEDITSELERAEDNVLETKKFFAKIQRKGYDRESPKYKEAFELLLSKVNPAIKKIAEEALEATKTISKVKASIAVGQQGQPMMEELKLWDRVKNFLRQIAKKMGSYNDYIEQALAQVSAKMVEVRHGSVKQMMMEMEGGITPAEAKKKVEEFLKKKNISYAKLSAKTIGFSDLARTGMVFVTVHGWKPSPEWDELKQLAIQNGFRVQAG